MTARFRIRTSQGQELSFASHDVFTEFVRSGELQPDDVVYDAETREWSSARTHPVVLQIESEAEGAGSGAVGGGHDDEDTDGGSPLPLIGDIGLELAPAPDQLSPEQEAAEFVAKMEAERASNVDLGGDMVTTGFTMEQGASGLVEEIAPPAPVAPVKTEPLTIRREPRPREPEPIRSEPVRPERMSWAQEREREEPAPPPKAKKAKKAKKVGSGEGAKYAPFVIVVIALGAAGVYFGPELIATRAGAGGETGTDSVVAPAEPPPDIPDTEDALRRRAQERFLSSTQTLLRGLDPVPEVWLRGRYLATPTDYPYVRAVWEEYLTTIREVRAGDDERYRAAYLRALDDARVQGSTRTLRLASASTDFQSAASERNQHYDHVEALANAALQGHDALVAAEGTIAYEPATGPGVSADPVIEAAGRSADAQALLEQVLDLILAELQGPGGPGEAARVREWVYGGLLDAVTN